MNDYNLKNIVIKEHNLYPNENNRRSPISPSHSNEPGCLSWEEIKRKNFADIYHSQSGPKSRYSKFIFFIIIFFLIFVSGVNLDNLQAKKNYPLKNIIEENGNKSKEFLTKINILESRINILKKSYYKLLPQKPYLIINTIDNEIDLMSKDILIHRGKCSTGSYILLKATNNRKWLFKTPKGMFRVKHKIKNPIWYKPDWAYLEEGSPIPTRYTSDRYEKGVLGDRALSLDDTHLIHGTPYKRMLGMPVTHGCIRLGDEELWIVYDNLVLGCNVFIY
jgi:L,D-transpeptidase ErfK/SrfK